jgi:hypothetical protein
VGKYGTLLLFGYFSGRGGGSFHSDFLCKFFVEKMIRKGSQTVEYDLKYQIGKEYAGEEEIYLHKNNWTLILSVG